LEYTVKNTNTVKRFKVFRNDSTQGTKVEFSFSLLRDKEKIKDLQNNIVSVSPNMSVYSIDGLAQMKIQTFKNRMRARDIYDIGFILDNWYNSLTVETKEEVARLLESFGTVEETLSLVETEFLNDPKLGEGKFYKTYGRLLDGVKRIEAELAVYAEQADGKTPGP